MTIDLIRDYIKDEAAAVEEEQNNHVSSVIIRHHTINSILVNTPITLRDA